MKDKIVFKLITYFVTVLLLFSIVLGGVFLMLFRQHTIAINRTSMEEKATSIAATLSSFQGGGNGMGQGHGMGGYGSYLRFLNELAMAEVWIVDQNLNLLTTHHGTSPTYAELPDTAEMLVKQIFKGETTYSEEFSSVLTTPSLTVGAPIYWNQTVVGAVLLHAPISGIDDAVRQGTSTLIIGVGMALILASIASILLSYHFTKPLRRIKDTALQLADRNYGAKTNVVQNDEIGQLAQTVDFLAQRLADAQEHQETLDKLKEDFVANVSHELRTPVAVLRGSLELLRDGSMDDAIEIQQYYDQMLMESLHLERLVNDLLDLSRLQDAQFLLDMGDLNLCDIIADAARAIRKVASKKQIQISVKCPEDECIINGDYGRIRQMILNLLDNSVKFSAPGGLVSMELKKDNHMAILSVSDCGVGIDPEDIPHVFERFRKANTSQNQSGTGLGLAIVKEIVDRHHAEIQVTSDKEKTCFSVMFYLVENS